MQLSPTIVATTVLESDNSQVLLDNLTELMRLGPVRLSDSHVVRIIYVELGKELTRLQRKIDTLQSLLNNAGPDTDPDATTLVSEELDTAQQQVYATADILAKWMERYPRCVPAPRLTLAKAKALLAVQPK